MNISMLFIFVVLMTGTMGLDERAQQLRKSIDAMRAQERSFLGPVASQYMQSKANRNNVQNSGIKNDIDDVIKRFNPPAKVSDFKNYVLRQNGWKKNEIGKIYDQLVTDLSNVIEFNPQYEKLLNHPNIVKLREEIRKFLLRPTQVVLKHRLLEQLRAIMDYYNKYIKTLTNDSEKGIVYRLLGDIQDKSQDRKITPKDILNLEKRFDQVALLLDDTNIKKLAKFMINYTDENKSDKKKKVTFISKKLDVPVSPKNEIESGPFNQKKLEGPVGTKAPVTVASKIEIEKTIRPVTFSQKLEGPVGTKPPVTARKILNSVIETKKSEELQSLEEQAPVTQATLKAVKQNVEEKKLDDAPTNQP